MIRNPVALLIAVLLSKAAQASIAGYPENPLRVGDSIYVSRQGVYRFDPPMDKPRWSSLEGVQTFAPVAYREGLLVGSSQGLYSLDFDSGRILWHIEKRRTVFSPSLSRRAYAGSRHGELYAIDPANGRIDWRRRFAGWIYSPALDAASATLYTGGQAHRVFALSMEDGSRLGEFSTSQEIVFSPVDLGDDRIGVNLFDGSSLVIDARSAEPAGILEGESQPTGLRRQGKLIYRSHGDGSLSAFDAASLAPRWRRQLGDGSLVMHPSAPDSLLVSDGDRRLTLLQTGTQGGECRIEIGNRGILPVLLDNTVLVLFRTQMQPPRLRLVQLQANCQ